MTFDANKTVREFAVELPTATRVFAKYGIDFCCGGGRPLKDACGNHDVATVLADLIAAEDSRDASRNDQTDYRSMLLGDLIDHIVSRHHAYVRSETPRLQGLLTKVSAKHGDNHPEVKQVQAIFEAVSQELSMHMMKEEQVLFPYVERMEEADLANEPVPPPRFGTVQNPVRMMMAEHDGAGDSLRQMRELTGDYTAPGDACMSFRALYQGLADFEADLHQHIHLENNILFPRAIAMEDGRNGEPSHDMAHPHDCCIGQ